MDDAARVRGAARGALADIEPAALRDRLHERLAEAAMTPGVLVFVCARALDPETAAANVSERAAGVQLIYEGLRLTRTLAREEPWSDAADHAADIDADLDIVGADVLVARGFYLLARTDAAGRAVETVRAFGRRETERRTDERPVERELEADAFELAVVAGATAVGADPPEELLAYAAELATDCAGEDHPLPATATLPETAAEQIADISGDRVPPSATDH